MLVDSYKQESNYKRKYRLVNVNEGIDLMPFIKNRDMKYSKFEQKKDGSMSANSMSFTLTFPYHTDNVAVNSTRPMMTDAELLKNYFTNYVGFKGLEEPQITGSISLANLIKKGDNIVFLEETENNLLIFDGIAEAPKLKRDKSNIYLNIEVKDRTYSLYEAKHIKEEFFQNIYLCNASEKDNSLIHKIAYRLGFKDEELDLPSFTTVIPFVLFKKDELIIKELAYAVRLIGGVFTIENKKLVVRAEANRITETYVFDKRNILSDISIDSNYPSYEKLKITYDYYFEKEKQDMWMLIGKNGNVSDANLVIYAGQDRMFTVDWLYNVDLVKEYELYESLFSLADGTEINFPYTLDIDETGGTLTLDNTANNYDVYVKKFKIRGIPLFMQQGNQSYYPANVESEKLLDNLENKLIQNADLSLLFLKANYNENCKLYRTLNFSTNVNNYLEPCRKIYLDHKDFTGYVVIEKIDFQGLKMVIQAREYLEPVNINDIKTLEKSSVDEYEIISNKFLTEKGLYEADLPLAPQNVMLIGQALGFTITFDNFSSNLRGHFVYLKKKSDVDWMKFFINTNNYFYRTTDLVTYEVKLSSISINGVEGETTEVKEVTPILLDNEVVDYPEGLSPDELNTKVQNINGSISDITDELNIHDTDIANIFEINDFHNQKIELIESDITSLRQKDNENYTAIQQNTTQIQTIAQKTAENEGSITQQGTQITQNAESIQTIVQEVAQKTTADEVETITSLAIENFSANEFRRTMGTSISKVDYSKSISDLSLQGISTDSEHIKGVLAQTYYSIISQNSKRILSLIKSSDEQYSSILQLVDSITLLVQEDESTKSLIQQLSDEINLLVQKDDENYSIITQLANELTFAVMQDNIVSSINQTAEEIKINAARIALGNGLVVEDDKVAVKSVFGLNFGLGTGVLGNQDGLILQSENFKLSANTTTGDFDLLAKGNIEFKNARNRIYLDKENGLSQIILKAAWENNGTALPEFEGVDFQIGEVGSPKGYFKFDDDEGVSMDIKNLKIDGNSILNYLSYKAEAGLAASSKYATQGMCKEFFGVTTFNAGWYIVKEKDGVSTTGQISYTDIVCNLYNVAPTRDIFSYDIEQLTTGQKKVVVNTVVGSTRTEYKIYVSDFATDSTCTLLYSSPSPVLANSFIDAYDSYSKLFVINDKIYYQILLFDNSNNMTMKTYSLTFAGVNTMIESQSSSSSLSNFKIMLFKKDNYIYFVQNNSLYKTQDFITNILVHSETELSGYTLVGSEIFKTKNSNKGKLWKISETDPATEYNTPLDYSNMAKGGKYYYFIADTHFYISLDLVTYKKIFKEDYNTLIYPQSNRTVIMKKRTDSTACDPYTMTGYTFGTLDW